MKIVAADIVAGAASFNITITGEAAEKLVRFAQLLAAANRELNLTAVPEERYLHRHLLDSLTVGVVPFTAHARTMIDVGAGAGFPGVPLAIWRPDLLVTLVESIEKKCAFMRDVIGKLEISNARVVNGRAETLGWNEDYRERFDIATARALAALPALAEYLLPLVRPGGMMIAMKGDGYRAELEAAASAVEQLGGGELNSLSISVPGAGAATALVTVEKIRVTPERFPRSATAIKKRPL